MSQNQSFAGRPDISHWDFPEDAPFVATYLNLVGELESRFQAIVEGKFSPPEFDRLVVKVCAAFDAQPWGLFRIFLDGRDYIPSVATSSFNIALVLSLVATAHQWDQEKKTQLVRSALLHDVGMLFLPEAVTAKEGRLTESERTILESHPSLSHEKLRRWGEPYESTLVALQHHEEWNGKGYPSGLKQDAIDPVARLVSVAVNFVARATQRRYRNSLVGYEAMKLLIKDQGTRFDPQAVKDFIRPLGLNPPGSIILLSDGSIARVMDQSLENLLRPRVRILIDSFGNAYRDDRGALVELVNSPKIYIARPVNFQDLLEAREH